MTENPEPENEPDEITLSRAEYEALFAKVKELEAGKDQFLRAAADFENAKKRLTRERDEIVKFSQENLIRDLLPVLDNLERALSHAGEIKDSAAKGVVAGIQMVFKQLQEVLKGQGLKRLQTVGEKFDPHQHEAVTFLHEEGKEDEIVEEIQPGYFLHQRLLRAAKVKVRVHPQANSSESEEKQEEIT